MYTAIFDKVPCPYIILPRDFFYLQLPTLLVHVHSMLRLIWIKIQVPDKRQTV